MQYLCLLLTPFCFLVAGPAVVASPTAKVRSSSNPACTTNTALQELQQNSVSASAFCSTYIPVTTSTRTVFVHKVKPTFITSTATATYTVYPGGRHLESISIAPFVDNEPATLVSSACSCLSLAAPTTTITASESTVYVTTTTTTTSTLTGLCATQTPYLGAYSVQTLDPIQQFEDLSFEHNNAYDCCVACQNVEYLNLPGCLLWYSEPGHCYIVVRTAIFGPGPCIPSQSNAIVDYLTYPQYLDFLGGPGPCAGTITLQFEGGPS